MNDAFLKKYMFRKKTYKRIFWVAVFLFIFMNIIAFLHAYKFTHFSNENKVRTDPKNVSVIEKIGLAFTGVDEKFKAVFISI